jgi:hypothetical protein
MTTIAARQRANILPPDIVARVVARIGAFNGFSRSAARAGARGDDTSGARPQQAPEIDTSVLPSDLPPVPRLHAFVQLFRSANIVSALRWQIFSMSSLGRSSDSMTAIVARM